MAEPQFDAPIAGMGMTHELGARPWQRPPLYTTVEEALDYYIPRMADDAFSDQLVDVMDMGVPLTTLANTIQMSGVMEGKHSADVGILIMPVLIEMMRLIGDSADIKYTTGMEKTDAPRSSLIAKAVNKLREEESKEEPEDMTMESAPMQEELPMDMPTEEAEPTGLMARRT
jgi:hypothetical protein